MVQLRCYQGILHNVLPDMTNITNTVVTKLDQRCNKIHAQVFQGTYYTNSPFSNLKLDVCHTF